MILLILLIFPCEIIIDNLGSSCFKKREAYQKIASLYVGIYFNKFLTQSEKHPDREVRRRLKIVIDDRCQKDIGRIPPLITYCSLGEDIIRKYLLMNACEDLSNETMVLCDGRMATICWFYDACKKDRKKAVVELENMKRKDWDRYVINENKLGTLIPVFTSDR